MAHWSTYLKYFSTIMMILTVGFGAISYDKRFPALLLPPFLYYYFENTSEEEVRQIPIIRVLTYMSTNAQRLVFALAGLGFGFGVNYLLG